jgi:hypothetical protein
MTTSEIIVLRKAADDLELGRWFYDGLELGVGDYFLDSLLSDIESLRLYAGMHSRYFGYHRLLARRVPFAVYYQFRDRTAWVVAILDMRQNPASIRSALGRR